MNQHRTSKPARRGSVAAVAGTAAATGRSLLDLIDSELSLTGRALLRAALMGMVAIALAGVGGLMLAVILVLLLQAAGLGWLGSVSLVTLAVLIFCSIATLKARNLLELCGLPATRRQLSRMFRESNSPESTSSESSSQPEPQA
ncbi:MAG: hypothetical protein R3F12_13505 [Lysobacteraceae bacterium]